MPTHSQRAEPIATETLVSSFIFPMSHRLSVFSLALAPVYSVWGQQAPDAGRVLQEQQQINPTVPSAPQVNVPLLQATESAAKAPAGAQVVLQSVEFVGNTVFANSVLQEVLGLVSGQSLDLPGMQGLTEQVTAFYRQAGYPLSYAFLPEQNLTEGTLRIQVVEGRYGQIQAFSNGEIDQEAQAFLAALQPGQPIANQQLERTLRVLGEQPGVKVTSSTMRAGQEAGTGNLDVRVQRGQAFKGELGFDNHGNRFTGAHGLRAVVQWDSPFMLGDQITAQATRTDEQLWFGHLGYSLPMGGSGLRASAGHAKTSYQLAKDFANLGATGTAEVSSIGLSYPLLRTQEANWSMGVHYEHKKLNDKRASFGADEHKTVDAMAIALQFDVRDHWAGGGISYGSISWTPGKLNLDESLKLADQSSGRFAEGHFNKLGFNMARLQATAMERVTLFGRLTAQWADQNLDSSEKMSLGGANGVRAYPVGEGMGDGGWLAQLELRYALGSFTPFAFYDAGRVQLNAQVATMTTAVIQNQRAVAGAGAGLRYSEGSWMSDVALAWRTRGGSPEADTTRSSPRVWVKVTYKL